MRTGLYKLVRKKLTEKRSKILSKGSYYDCLGHFHELEPCSYTHRKIFLKDEYNIIKVTSRK